MRPSLSGAVLPHILDTCWTNGVKLARTVRDASLDSRSARARLKVRAKPYYRSLDPGLHLGYRRSANGGSWLVRIYLGKQAYRTEKLATADDKADADGAVVLSFSQAQAIARARH